MRFALILAVLSFALSVCISGAAFAAPLQDTQGADSTPSTAQQAPDPQRQATRLARKLQLTPEQTAAIEPILRQRLQQIEQLRSDNSTTMRDRRARMRAIKQDTEQRLRAVLSDSQFERYRQLQLQARQRHQQEQVVPAAAASGQ